MLIEKRFISRRIIMMNGLFDMMNNVFNLCSWTIWINLLIKIRIIITQLKWTIISFCVSSILRQRTYKKYFYVRILHSSIAIGINLKIFFSYIHEVYLFYCMLKCLQLFASYVVHVMYCRIFIFGVHNDGKKLSNTICISTFTINVYKNFFCFFSRLVCMFWTDRCFTIV